MMQHLPLARKLSLYFTVLVYVSGIIGMQTAWRPWFISMTPFTLLLSVGVLLLHQPIFTARTHAWALGAYLVGFFAEVIGVNTGLIFGDYTYGTALGPMVWNTPLMIGVNWLLVTYVVNEGLWRVLPAKTSVFWGAVLGAGGCTLLDYLVEPGAIFLGYWTWAAGLPPLENYVGWFFVSLVVSLLYAKNMSAGLRNAAAPVLLVLQILFFAIVR
jgi:bisanhydrobacterioruberin hydratase